MGGRRDRSRVLAMKLIVEERGKQVIYELGDSSEPATIGRGLENTIPIRDPLASRRHVRIARRPDGDVLAEDLGSKNGTLVNGEALRTRLLRAGDCVRVGDVNIWYMERGAAANEGAPPQAPPAAPDRATVEREAFGAADVTKKRSPEDPPAIPVPPPPASEAADVGDEPTLRVLQPISARAKPPAAATPAKMPEPGDATVAAIPGSRFFLEGVEGTFVGKRLAIERFPFRLGRAKKNAVVLNDTNVSVEHCEIVSRGEGCAVVDLGSTNGTKVNGARVKRAVLADGARLSVGVNTFVFRDEEAKKPGAGAPTRETEAPRVKASAVARARRREVDTPTPEPDDVSRRPEPARTHERVGSGASPEGEEDGLAGAAADLGRTASQAAVEEADGPGLGLVAAALVTAALVAAGAIFVTSLRGRAPDSAEADPAPRGNAVRNWSFEEIAPDGSFPGWEVAAAPVPGEKPDAEPLRGAALTLEQKLVAGGSRAARLAAADRPLEARSASPLVLTGLDVQVRGMVAGGRTHAGLAVVWGSSRDPAFRLVSATDLPPRGGSLAEVRATFRPPPGADQARVALLGDGAVFDRVSLVEREAQGGRGAGARLESRGLALRHDDRGAVSLSRDEWAVVDRATLALLGEGRMAALARQETALSVAPAAEPRPAGATKEKAPPPAADGAKRFSGRLLLPSGEGATMFEETLAAVADSLTISYKLAGPQAGVAPAIVFYLEDAERAAAFELSLPTSSEKRDPPFQVEDVREIAFGVGGDQVFFRPDAAGRVTAERLGRGLLVTIAAPPGAGGISLVYGRGSTRERVRVVQLFEAAEALKKAGKLDEARRAFARIGREFGHDAPVRDRAIGAARALEARAEAALAEAAAIEADIQAVGVIDLLAGAEERCRFVAQSYEGTQYATRAAEILDRVAGARVQLEGRARIDHARELLATARRHIEARQYRLARLALRGVLERYADVRECVADARRDLEFAEKQMKDARP